MLYFVFWACVFLVLYTYVGYGFILYFLAKYWPFRKEKAAPSEQELPALTLCIAAYNEADIIALKMENSLSLNYPADKLTILWVIDGTTDHSAELLKGYPGVELLYRKERLGKTAAINHAMEHITTELVVFTDANCLLSKDALYLMARAFEDETVGCVAGEKRVAYYEDDTAASKGEGFYWQYESLLKKWDNAYYSTIGAAGELFAIRKALYTVLPSNILLDDFMVSMRIAQRGYRIAYIPEAYAVERGSLNIEEEKKRKIRISAGGWQSVWLLRSLLNIFRYGRLSFQYISHRVLRWIVTPFALLLLLPLNVVLAFMQGQVSPFYTLILVLQVAFYALALVGYKKREEEQIAKVFFVPFYFMFMNFSVFEGLLYLKNKSKSAVWEKSIRKV